MCHHHPIWITSRIQWWRLPQIAKFMGPTWGPPGSCRPQMGPMDLVIRGLLYRMRAGPNDWHWSRERFQLCNISRSFDKPLSDQLKLNHKFSTMLINVFLFPRHSTHAVSFCKNITRHTAHTIVSWPVQLSVLGRGWPYVIHRNRSIKIYKIPQSGICRQLVKKAKELSKLPHYIITL